MSHGRGTCADGAVFIPPSPEANQWWGFMSAVQQYATLADQDGKRLLDACPEPDTKTTDILRVFTKYAQEHRDRLNQSAAAMAYNALADAFPCK